MAKLVKGRILTLLDRTDEELVRAALRRLPPPEIYGLRERGGLVNVSRGTVAKWDRGHYSMSKTTRRKVVVFLQSFGVDDATLEDEQARVAAGESSLGPGSLWRPDQTGTGDGRGG